MAVQNGTHRTALCGRNCRYIGAVGHGGYFQLGDAGDKSHGGDIAFRKDKRNGQPVIRSCPKCYFCMKDQGSLSCYRSKNLLCFQGVFVECNENSPLLLTFLPNNNIIRLQREKERIWENEENTASDKCSYISSYRCSGAYYSGTFYFGQAGKRGRIIWGGMQVHTVFCCVIYT